MNPPMNWVPVILVCPVLACSSFVVWFCVLFGFVLCVFAVCLVYDDDGPMDYVQVLPQFSFAALNSRWPGTLICITAHAMSYSVVNDLAKAMKALDGKKISYSLRRSSSSRNVVSRWMHRCLTRWENQLVTDDQCFLFDHEPRECIQSRSLSGRHVSTSFFWILFWEP